MIYDGVMSMVTVDSVPANVVISSSVPRIAIVSSAEAANGTRRRRGQRDRVDGLAEEEQAHDLNGEGLTDEMISW